MRFRFGQVELSRRAFLAAAAGAAAWAACPAGSAAQFAEPATRPVPFRPFKASSYWNTPIPADAPIDKESARFIADFKEHSGNHLRLVLSEKWSNPVYWVKEGHTEYTIEAAGGPYRLRLPKGAYTSTGSDAAMTIIDVERKVTHSLHHARYENGRWAAGGVAVYYTESNGLDGRLPQSDERRNCGHRGIPPTVMMVRKDEIEAGVIAHKLELFAHATADAHFFPMVGHERRRGGVIPEGMLLRVKPSVDLGRRNLKPNALVIATALQMYGIVVGDNSGSGNNLKVERAGIGLVGKDDLAAVTWDDWEVIARSYGAGS